MVENIVNSYNLFIDSSTGRDGASKGDNYHLHLGNAGIVCEAGQYIRLTLNNVTMHKTFTDINANNSQFTVRDTPGSSTEVGNLTSQNHTTLNSLATDFATQLGNIIKTLKGLAGGTTITPNTITPSSTTTIGGDSDHIISFNLVFSNPHGISSTGDVICQMYSEHGDTYEILGGNRINSTTDTTTASITISVTNATTLAVQCLYPAQRHTTAFIYLRGTGIPNTSIESMSLSHPSEDHRTDTIDSDILARIPVDIEYCNYDAQSGREYFMNVKQKQINTLTLRLTDAKNRPLGRVFGSSSKTASGSGTDQSTLGNLSFSAVIRVDVVQQRQIKELESEPLTHKTAARFENVLMQPKFGRDAYGSGVGK
jgi:hypothetical protein